MSQITLDEIISHRAPMSLLSRFVSSDDESALCEIDVTPETAFFDDSIGGVPAHIGIEYIAQTIAAYAGKKARDSGEQVKIGFLLGTRKLQLHEDRFHVGETYQVRVEQLYLEDNGLAVFEATVSHGNSPIVSGNINTFQPDDVMQFLEEDHID